MFSCKVIEFLFYHILSLKAHIDTPCIMYSNESGTIGSVGYCRIARGCEVCYF